MAITTENDVVGEVGRRHDGLPVGIIVIGQNINGNSGVLTRVDAADEHKDIPIEENEGRVQVLLPVRIVSPARNVFLEGVVYEDAACVVDTEGFCAKKVEVSGVVGRVQLLPVLNITKVKIISQSYRKGRQSQFILLRYA